MQSLGFLKGGSQVNPYCARKDPYCSETKTKRISTANGKGILTASKQRERNGTRVNREKREISGKGNKNRGFNRRWEGIDADFTGETKHRKLTDGKIPTEGREGGQKKEFPLMGREF